MAIYLKGVMVALKGLPRTLQVSAFALVVGIVLGLFLALAKMSGSKVLKVIASVYIEVIRSTPMIAQALIMAYGVPMILQSKGINFKWGNLLIPALIVCGLNSAAYMAEVIRSGIQAIDKGQIEAAHSLGMSKRQVNMLIVLPQAFKIVIPALVNELVTLIKETSILAYVGVVEVIRSAQLWNATTFETFPAYVGAAVVYFIVCFPMSKGVQYLEKRLSADKPVKKSETEKSEGKGGIR